MRLVVRADTGAVAQRMGYDAFGRVVEDTNPGFQPFGYAGGLWDAETGLVHFGAREYDPALGRFLTKDPILFAGGANLYGYCLGDPVNSVDPMGWGPVGGWDAWWEGFLEGAYDGYIGWSNGFLNTLSFGFVPNYADTSNFGQRWGSWCGTGSAIAAQTALFSALDKALSGDRILSVVHGDDAVTVSRWGREGLQSGDFVMRGKANAWNYVKSGKWQQGLGNQQATLASGQQFSVPPGSLKGPWSASSAGAFDKGLFGLGKLALGQSAYIP